MNYLRYGTNDYVMNTESKKIITSNKINKDEIINYDYTEIGIKDIIEDSNRIFYEEMNFKALQKRAKDTKKNDYTSTIKTKKGEVREICKFKKKNYTHRLEHATTFTK